MRLPRLLLTALYVGYLVQVGLLMVVLPWSNLWHPLIARLPLGVMWLMDAPATRGAVTGFGVLHLLLVVAEVVYAGHRDGLDPTTGPSSPNESQESLDPPRS